MDGASEVRHRSAPLWPARVPVARARSSGWPLDRMMALIDWSTQSGRSGSIPDISRWKGEGPALNTRSAGMTSATLGRLRARLFFLALDLLFGLPFRPRDTGIREHRRGDPRQGQSTSGSDDGPAPPGRRSARIMAGCRGGRPGPADPATACRTRGGAPPGGPWSAWTATSSTGRAARTVEGTSSVRTRKVSIRIPEGEADAMSRNWLPPAPLPAHDAEHHEGPGQHQAGRGHRRAGHADRLDHRLTQRLFTAPLP